MLQNGIITNHNSSTRRQTHIS